jgi:hypothetical protein
MNTQQTPSKPIRLQRSLAAIAAFGLLLAGCVVTSVYPWYTAKDVVFEPALIGTWRGTESDAKPDEFWQFEKLEDRAYKLIMAEGGKRKEFDTHLFKLGGHLFLDCFPRERPEDSLPPHYLLRVGNVSPVLEITALDYDWLKKLLEKNPKTVRHLIVPKKLGESGDGDLVLTAETVELQKFILKHVNNTNAFGKPAQLKHQ